MNVPIVGRQSELELIDHLIDEKTSQPILCIEGVGGIGKTRLLQEVGRLYNNVPTLKIVGILDFDDLALATGPSISSKIIEILGHHEVFSEYIEEFNEFRLIQQAGWSVSAVARKENKLQNTFHRCLNKFTAFYRLVFLFDTAERISTGDTLEYIKSILCNLQNSLIVFAGRSTPYDYLTKTLEDNTRLQKIELQQLSISSSEEYLEEKQRALKIVLPQEIRKKLIFLSEGSPILLEMAIDWIIQGDSPDSDWLAETKYHELAQLSSETHRQKQREFESKLVHHIYDFQGLKGLESFILTLSIAYPLNVRGIAAIMDIPEIQAESLINYARQQVYVKSLPGNYISLHDRMRDMVEEYVWLVEDKRGDRRQDIHTRMVSYMKILIDETKQNLSDLIQQQNVPINADKIDFKAFAQREILERQLHSVLEIQFLYHIGHADPQSAYAEFLLLFDAALKDYRLTNCSTLLSRLDQFRFYKNISYDQKFEIDFRYANYLTYYAADYTRATEILDPYLVSLPNDPSKQIDILRMFGNIRIRSGNLREAISLFQRAAEISENLNLLDKLIETSAALGWAYRHLSYWSKAADHYNNALRLCFTSGRKDELFISLHNSLALVLGYLQKNQALTLCAQAVEYSKRFNLQRSLASSYLTNGSVFYQFGRLDDALEAVQSGLRIFEPAHEEEQLSWAYSWQAVVLWAKSQQIEEKDAIEYLKRAESLFNASLDLGFISHKPMTLNRLGRVYFARGDYEKAYQIWKEGYEISCQISDGLFELCGIRDLASLAVAKRQYDQYPIYKERMKKYEDAWKTPHGHTWGGGYLYIGLLALGNNAIDDAKYYIARGLEIIVDYGTYGVQDLGYYLKGLTKNILKIASLQLRIDLSTYLKEHWLHSENKLFEKHPEAMWFFDEWVQN